MKKILIPLLILPLFCVAKKNPCRQIKRTWNTEKKTHGCESPTLPHITVIKQNKPTTFFVLRLYVTDAAAHYDTKGAAVEFEDGTILNDDNVKVNCAQEPMTVGAGSFGTETHAGGYALQGFFKITEENIDKFMSTRVKRIQLHGAWAGIQAKEAKNVMTYVACMKDMK